MQNKFKIKELTTNIKVYEQNLNNFIKYVEDDIIIHGEDDNLMVDCRLVELEFENGDIVETPINVFICSFIFWRPFVSFSREISKEDIVDLSHDGSHIKEDKPDFNTHMERIRSLFFDKKEVQRLNEDMATIIEESSYISQVINHLLGETISFIDLQRLQEEVPKVHDYLNFKIDPNTSSRVIEEEIRKNGNELITLLKQHDNCFRNYLNCGVGVNVNQAIQCFVNVGCKPDLDGNVYPVPVSSSIMQGFNSVSDYFIDSTGGRKSAIINFFSVKDSGYLSRKLTLLCFDVHLNYDNQDCHTEEYVIVDVTDKGVLGRLNGRFYMSDTGLECIDVNSEKSKELIGTEIKLRSPITCAGHDGKVCRTCYGKLAELNHDIHIGKVGVDFLSEQLTQLLLSSKHFLATYSVELDWGKLIPKLFRFESNTILALSDNILSGIDLGIDSTAISWEDDEDQVASIDNITFYNGTKEVNIPLPTKVFLSEVIIAKMLKTKDSNVSTVRISLKDLTVDDVLFFFVINNNELSGILDDITNLIETKDHLGITNKNEFYNKFIYLLNRSGIHLDSVHMELITRELLRSSKNLTERNYIDGDYTILRLSDAITNSPSITVSLSFERLKDQFLNPKTFKKSRDSYMDILFQ